MVNYVFIPEEAVGEIIRQACEKLREKYDKKERFVIIGIERGGFEVAKRVNTYLPNGELISFDYDKNPPIDESDREKIKGKRALLCEDSILTGNTLNKAIHIAEISGAKELQIFAIACREKSKIIPNIYSLESDENTIFIFPWKTLPLRLYDIDGIIRNFTGMEEQLGLTTEFFATDIRPNFHKYNLITIGIEAKGGLIIGLLQMWEGEDEIIVETLQSFLPDNDKKEKEIISKLTHIVLNYQHFHKKRKITYIVPENEYEKWKNAGYKVAKFHTISDKKYVEVYLTEIQ